MTRKRYTPRKPLPGSNRMRSNARKRTATWIENDTWKVTGGEHEHVVTAGQYSKPETFKCDCGLPEKRTDHLCCHIFAVMWEM